MKRKITLLLIVFMALISFESYAQDISTLPDGKYVFNQNEITPAQVKALKAVNKDVICIFENFEWNDNCTYGYNNTIGNWTDTNRVGEYYFPWIKADPRYGKYTVKLIYSDATLAAYDMTDFDVVIFPMGHYPINVQTTGGTKVVTVINELLAANKCVIIWGDAMLYHAFDGASANKDPDAADFFTNKLQLEYRGRKNLIEGSYFKPFAMFGPANEYISKGLVQFCNINANPHGNDGTAPARSMRASVETFGLIDEAETVPHDYYTDFVDMTNINKYNDEIVKTDDLLGCHRKMEGAGKIVYWSIGFEIMNYAYWHNILEIQDLLWRSIRWCYQDMLLPEPFLEFSHEPLEFGEVPVGGAKELDFEITNVGGDVLEITELHYDDFNFIDAADNYEIIEGGITVDDPPLRLDPLEKHKCRVKFIPTEQSMYEGGVEVWSNATNGELLGMSMTGHGGNKIEQGPHMVVVDTVQFGKIKLGKGIEVAVVFENIGTERLKIPTLEITNTADNSFAFRNYKVPVWVDPQGLDSSITIRFSGNQVQEYVGELRVVSNDADYPDHIVYLKAEAVIEAGSAVLTVDHDAKLEFNDVEAGTKADMILELSNTGNAKLVIEKVELVGDSEFTLEDYNPEYSIELIPGKTRDLKVRFRPEVAGTYSSKLFLTSNDKDNPVFEVPITGSTISGVKDGKAYSEDNSLLISASPNPFSANSVITLTSSKANAQKVKLYLIDMSGRKVMDIAENSYTFGIHTVNMSSLNLASGTYILVAETPESSAKLAVVINK